MSISPDEQKRRAVVLSKRFKDIESEKSYAHLFLQEFMNIFGIDIVFDGRLEKRLDGENTQGDTGGYMDYYLEYKIIIEMKSKGEDLKEAIVQAEKYHWDLKSDLTPDRIMVCDFEHFILVNKNENNFRHEFDLDKLHLNIHLFKFFNEYIDKEIRKEVKVSRDASDIMGTIYTRLQENNYKKEDTEKMLIRLVYCLFAEDTGIFQKDSFRNHINNMKTDLKYVGPQISKLFDVLNTKLEDREKSLEPSLKNFPYLNGSLFKSKVQSPSFSKDMYESLLKATDFEWSGISPAIFGTLFQTVMDKTSRREEGAHFTSEENILKVINPLFLDDLYLEFEKIKTMVNKKKTLEEFHIKISQLKFFDPACGAGNFLIITYKQLRKLEIKILDEMGIVNQMLDVSSLIKVNVNQFYGIEKNKFSANIARVALWMMDHVMNNKVSEKYGQVFIRIPLIDHPTIKNEDALEYDWNEVLHSSECSYILGNPPFIGARVMVKEQKNQLLKITKNVKGVGALDYVTAWFIKASQYVGEYTPHTHSIKIGFVATNSITQGDQVYLLWQILKKLGQNIIFAYNSFIWKSGGKGNAQVTVVILGLSKNNIEPKRLFDSDDIETNPKFISLYLKGFKKELPIVNKSNKILNQLPKMKMGTMPIDDGHYIFTDEQKQEFLKIEPNAEKLFKPFIDGFGLINNVRRWILVLCDVKPNELSKLPFVKKRIELVKAKRQKSRRSLTRELDPKKFDTSVIPTKPFLALPSVSAENRDYVPIEYLHPPIIPHNKIYLIENATVSLFGLLTSKMHIFWLRSIGGKLETRFNYSIGNVYNTFPVPDNYSSLEPFAQKILDIRKNYPDSNLFDLYDSITMPDDLRKAHHKLDGVTDKLYRKDLFTSDDDRLEFLLTKYIEMKNKDS